MQHVEEAGVHSGDSACVLPAPALNPLERTHVEEVVRELGAALGVVGLLNVQLAIAEGELYVLEVNPRASRTVPFASKASGINLVAAACRLAAGADLGELELPADPTPSQVSVKAAVLPFARFPGADPVLGPEMPSALPGARCQQAGRRSSRSATATRRRSFRSPMRSWGSASTSSPPRERRACSPVPASRSSTSAR